MLRTRHLIGLIISLFLCAQLGCSTQSTAVPTRTPEPPHIPATVVWGAAGSPETEKVRTALQAGRYEKILERVNHNLRLPEKLEVLFQDKDGPLYDRKQNALFFSYDFVLETERDFLESGYCKTEDEAREETLLTAEFVFLHELTHALLDILDLPILGQEEDVADGLAAVAAGSIIKSPEMALATAGSLHVIKKKGSRPEKQYWSRHSLDEQRYYRILGFAYGSDPERVGPMIKELNLVPEEWWQERAPGCQADYQRLHRSWLQVLKPHRPKDFAGAP